MTQGSALRPRRRPRPREGFLCVPFCWTGNVPRRSQIVLPRARTAPSRDTANTAGNFLTLMTKMLQAAPLLPRFFSLYPIRPSLLRIC